ncbi:peptide chain release factor N(5)-glutamine methyltransferase [Actibacterium lipolyticum]|uniref:Release factor glutamine methyltransferase n=1 Tax=Actibacterium lipolyticum TaxID=1524263 RepID=A0A238JVG6_9RHOB|nr:peptide chain release factor N(5)-glutamine methyltransferase [Actibacterium lipolyticum]SMX34493.1 Release factor glutamine methyltransferase [Actibacterium lipolyticum]
MSRTVGAAMKDAAEALSRAGVESAAKDARLLMARTLGRSIPDPTDQLNEADEQLFADLVDRRIAREPLSHILGQRAFFKHEFHVSKDVLDPRPETEALVVEALSHPFETVVDLGVGSGAILLSLLAERPTARGLGTDKSQAALAVAQQNAQRLGVAERCEFKCSDWFEDVDGRFDLIVSNPPYIAADEMPALAPELSYEPEMALTDHADGLSAYRAIAAGALGHLTPGGALMVEIGPTQAADVRAIFQAAGLENVVVRPDLDGRDRVVSARAPATKPF